MSAFSFDTIFTLDARTNVLLEVTTDRFGLSSAQVYETIQGSFHTLKRGLYEKGIDYTKLKAALVPSTTREEWAYLFDWQKSKCALYGREAVHSMLPLLNPQGTHSLLCGDWLCPEGFAKWVEVSQFLEISPELEHAANDGASLFLIYVNNLPSATARNIKDKLHSCDSYLGALNLTRPSPLKARIARHLVRAFIKHREFILQAHEDDRPFSENINNSLFDFESFGMINRSVPSWLYGPFLSFKIESPPILGERDVEFALNAISDTPIKLSECRIQLEESKYQYLLAEKTDSLKRAGMSKLSMEEVVLRIRSKLESNYIYSLSRSNDGQVLKFNVILELSPGIKSLISLEYIPAPKDIRVITFY